MEGGNVLEVVDPKEKVLTIAKDLLGAVQQYLIIAESQSDGANFEEKRRSAFASLATILSNFKEYCEKNAISVKAEDEELNGYNLLIGPVGHAKDLLTIAPDITHSQEHISERAGGMENVEGGTITFENTKNALIRLSGVCEGIILAQRL